MQPHILSTEAMMEPLPNTEFCKRIREYQNRLRARINIDLGKCLPLSSRVRGTILGNDR